MTKLDLKVDLLYAVGDENDPKLPPISGDKVEKAKEVEELQEELLIL